MTAGAEGSEPRLLVVVPAWNERQSLPAVLTELRTELPWADVVVVDDGSTDGTAEVARECGVTVLRLPFNVGVGGAVRAGFVYGHRNGYDAVVQVDADGQHDPRDVPRLLALAQEGADVVVGARFSGVGDYRSRGLRRLAMSLLSGSVSRLAGEELRDVTSGFRLSSRRAVAFFARTYPPEYLGDTVESLVMAHRAGLVIRQVPVAMRPRLAGTPSQNALRSAFYVARAVLVLALAVVRREPEVGVS